MENENTYQMPIGQIKRNIGKIIDRCPSCDKKNIIYSMTCGFCKFSWETYFLQEKGKKYDN